MLCMDSECPTASRTAGQPTSAAGASFTFTAMQSSKPGNPTPEAGPLGASGQSGSVAPAASPGLRPHRHSADGDGR